MTSTERITQLTIRVCNFIIGGTLRGACYVYKSLLQPLSKNEDDKRRERILTIILFCISLFLLFLESAIISERVKLRQEYSGINIYFFTSIIFICIYLYYLARTGYYKVAAYIFVCTYFTLTVYGSIHYGASMPAGLLSYVLVIIMASIIIGTRFGSIIAGASITSVLIIGFIEHIQGIVHHWRLRPIKINDLIQYSVFFLLIAVVSWLSNSEMERSLKRARASEQLLKEQRDNLELLVEARTQALREAEQERVSQLTRFAEFGKRSAGLFHDLLGPLSALTLTVGGLQKEKSNQEINAAIANAIDATHRMQRFMNTIRKQLTEDEIISSFSVQQQIQDALHLLHYQATHANVTITVKIDRDVTLVGNPFKFTQIITNVTSNAIESYEENNTSNRNVIITVSANDLYCTITITDQGIGIPPAILPHIFDTFYTTKTSGIGLGLATVQDIIEKLFLGSITCTSSTSGTTFTIIFPLNELHQNNTINT